MTSKEDDDPRYKIGDEIGVASIVYSVFKKAAVVGIVYAVGYFNFSIAWFICPVVLSVIRDQWRQKSERKRNIAKAAALASEKDVVLARIDDLPAWVFFPDVERVEWVNRIVKQVWPNVNHYARGLIRDSIQPTLQRKLEGMKIKGFRFERIILGSVPPRIGGVKVYDKNVSRSEIIMDVDLFYAGDCDINFTLSGIKGGIKDFQLQGMMRVVMKPLITTMPLIGGLQVFFLNNPEIDFNLVGIADVLDMPGLSDLLRKVIVEQIASMMVLPNKFPIQLSDSIEAAELKAPEPEGVLRVHVVEAKHLMKKDIGMLGKGKSDPYAVITVGAQEFKTKTINNSVDPKWDFWCEFSILETRGQQVFIHLWDFDEASDDEQLGRATIEIENVVKKGQEDMWITLEQAKHGMVHVRLSWLVLSKNYSDLQLALEETQRLRVTAMSTALLTIFIDSAKNLLQMRPQSKADPYVVARVGKNLHQTSVQMRTSDPVWEEGFTFLVGNPESDTLYLTVMDHKTSAEMGGLTYNLTGLAAKDGLEIVKQPFALSKAGGESRLLVSMHLRVLKSNINEDVETDEPYVNPSLERQGSSKSVTSNISETRRLVEAEKEDDNVEGFTQQPEGVEEIITSADIAPVEGAMSRDDGLLHRTVSKTSSAGDAGLGRIQLTLKYSVPRQRLIVVVHKVSNIPLKDPSNIPDPYVKMYLLPERSKESKRKTVAIKDNCNPVFDENFEYIISQGELNNKQLEITVGTKKQLFYSSSNILGQVILDLGQLNLLSPYTAWLDLQPERESN